MSATYTENWLLVEYGNDTKGIIHSRYIMDKENVNLCPGSSFVIRKRGERQLVTFLARSNKRPLLQHLLDAENASQCGAPDEPCEDYSVAPKNPRDYSRVATEEPRDYSRVATVQPGNYSMSANEKPRNYSRLGPKEPRDYSSVALEEPRDYSRLAPEEPRDYSGVAREEPGDYLSSSSWVPSDDDDSESEVEYTKSRPSKEYMAVPAKRNKKMRKYHRINTVQPPSRRMPTKGLNKFGTQKRRNLVLQTNEDPCNDLTSVVQYRMEPSLLHLKIDLNKVHNKNALENLINKIVSSVKYNIGKSKPTHKARTYTEKPVSLHNRPYDTDEQSEHNDEDWVPIGSGKTLIPKETFRKIKWKSYTIATRTLMLAVFPRRTLATHSLTGKPSPAFQDKPAKMCLDPKKVSDIISEVMDRFDVTESRVRSIITTKCADEAKMYRMRLNKRNSTLLNNEKPSFVPLEVTKNEQIIE